MSFPDYETAIGKEIKAFLSKERNYPIELQHLLFAANRWEKSEEIKAHLQSGKTLIVNRYTESNLVYGLANGLDRRWLESLENGLPKTNLVIVLDAPPQSLKSRRAGSSKDAYERNSALQNKAQKAYRELARENGWKLVDADRPVEEVQNALLKIVKDALAGEGRRMS
jgi:dTMP kinase